MNVALGPRPRVFIERAHGNHPESTTLIETRHGGTANAAEPMSEVFRLRRPVLAQELLTAQISKTIERDDEVRGVPGAARLSATAAMAMRGATGWGRHFELDPAAQTTSSNAFHASQAT